MSEQSNRGEGAPSISRGRTSQAGAAPQAAPAQTAGQGGNSGGGKMLRRGLLIGGAAIMGAAVVTAYVGSDAEQAEEGLLTKAFNYVSNLFAEDPYKPRIPTDMAPYYQRPNERDLQGGRTIVMMVRGGTNGMAQVLENPNTQGRALGLLAQGSMMEVHGIDPRGFARVRFRAAPNLEANKDYFIHAGFLATVTPERAAQFRTGRAPSPSFMPR